MIISYHHFEVCYCDICTLQAGLDVMLSVPRQANDTMYLCMIEGFNVSVKEMFHSIGKICHNQIAILYCY